MSAEASSSFSPRDHSFSLPNDLKFNTARTLTLQDTKNWLVIQPYYVPSVDDTPDRLKQQMTYLQESNNKEVTELYRGRMPARCIADLAANRTELVQQVTSVWRVEGVPDEELESRTQTLQHWIDERISDAVLGSDLATKARLQSSRFAKTMTDIAKDMARGDSNRVKLKFTGLLVSSRPDVHRFLMFDKENNKSHFYEALVAHFVDPNDSSYNPFKLITLDKRSTLAEPPREFKKPFEQIEKQIGSQTYQARTTFLSGKAAETREKAVRYFVQAWTPSEDVTQPTRMGERIKGLLAPRRRTRVTYLPDTSLTDEFRSSTGPAMHGAVDEVSVSGEDGYTLLDSRPGTAISTAHETDSIENIGPDATEPVQLV